MTIQDIVALARAEADRHGFAGVPIRTDNSKRRMGGCCHRGDEILYFTFSAVLMTLVSDAEVLDTILHEIAHAKAPQAKHGLAWQIAARAIGAKPQPCAAVSIDAKMAGYKYIAACACGPHVHGKMPETDASCHLHDMPHAFELRSTILGGIYGTRYDCNASERSEGTEARRLLQGAQVLVAHSHSDGREPLP